MNGVRILNVEKANAQANPNPLVEVGAIIAGIVALLVACAFALSQASTARAAAAGSHLIQLASLDGAQAFSNAAQSLSNATENNGESLLAQGDEYYASGSYSQAFQAYSDAVSAGNSVALFRRGKCYFGAYGTSQSYSKAFDDFDAFVNSDNVDAAELAEAQGYAGLCRYYDEADYPNGKRESYEWFSASAEKGSAVGLFGLGLCCKHGYGVAKDEAKMVDYYRQAADMGFAKAQVNLGACYEEGRGGLTANFETAADLYAKAADQGSSLGQIYLAQLYYYGKGVTADKVRAKELAEAACSNEHDFAGVDEARAFLEESGL